MFVDMDEMLAVEQMLLFRIKNSENSCLSSMVDNATFEKMKVIELRTELDKYNLSKNSVKNVLIAQLKEGIKKM